MEAICSIGMKEDNLRLQELSSSEKRRTVKANRKKRLRYRGDNRGNLSPPVLAKNKGTAVFRLVPLQGEVSGSVPRLSPYTTERIYSLNTVLHLIPLLDSACLLH